MQESTHNTHDTKSEIPPSFSGPPTDGASCSHIHRDGLQLVLHFGFVFRRFLVRVSADTPYFVLTWFILILGTRWRRVVSLTPRPPYLGEKPPVVKEYEAGWAPERSECLENVHLLAGVVEYFVLGHHPFVSHHLQSNNVGLPSQDMYLLQTSGPLWGPPSLTLNDYRRPFPGGKAAGASSSPPAST